MARSLGSDTTTQGIRVQVFPRYMPEYSHPGQPQCVFSYRVVLSNEGDRWAKLLARHWIIINADGKRNDVRGPGVIGLQPELPPGYTHEYESFCPIDTEWGTMEGTYQMVREDGDTFDAVIGRFYLAKTEDPGDSDETPNPAGRTSSSATLGIKG
ncbi:MAG: Co2+/Mg2+ efflux protein ApaG [candidate division Zixibacteria bacterium]|nr:Co2+/Mg2+ efflux protein ApaG [candidate division Zixibacteria bacterium]